MGSYGIGVSRAVAAIAEQTLDDLGLCWPGSVAPADVHLIATGKDDRPFAAAEARRGRAGGRRAPGPLRRSAGHVPPASSSATPSSSASRPS